MYHIVFKESSSETPTFPQNKRKKKVRSSIIFLESRNCIKEENTKLEEQGAEGKKIRLLPNFKKLMRLRLNMSSPILRTLIFLCLNRD